MGSPHKFRLSTVLILPLVLEVVVAAGLVGFFSFRNGQKAVNDLANQLLAEVNVRIEQQVDQYLEKTRAVVELNLRAINMGMLDLRPQNFDAVARLFWNQVQTFDVTYIGFATSQDEYVGAGYYEEQPDIAKAVAPNNDTLSYFSPDELGQPTNDIQTQPLDPKHSEQPFYQLPVAARQTVWTGVTNWNTEPDQISIDLATPIYNGNQQLQGVLATTVSLSFINEFLRGVQIGKTGQAFIMDRSGKLVATSSTEPSYRVVNDTAEQISAADSSEALIQATAVFVAEYFDGLQNVQESQSLSFKYQGQRQFLLIAPYTDEFALDWLIVTVIPEQDFLAQIQAHNYRTLLLCIGAAILTIIVGLLMARRIARPMLNIARASAAIAAGDLNQQVPSSQIREIDQLSGAFNSMAQQLKISFTTLEQHNEKLKHLDQLKDEFLANTSHELRNPLNGMIGIAESMIDGATGQLTEIQKRNLWMVAQSGYRLSDLVNDILDFSKLKHKGIELQLKPVSLRGLVEVVLTLSQPLIGSKELTLINDVSPDLPAAVADENRLQQILYNLVGNAIKFTPSGLVKVSAVHRPAEVGADCDMVAVTVADTGIGIAEDKLERIFEAFEQAEGSTAREYGGTGLGLAVTQQLVELHHGKLTVTSTEGVGSQFTFTLPVAAAESREVQYEPAVSTTRLQRSTALTTRGNWSGAIADTPLASPSQPTQAAGSVVLVVDDEPVNLQVLANHLSMQDYAIVQASNGEDALQLIEQGLRPSIILLDVMMPKMTGYEVTQRLRERYPVTDLPIVLLTAKTQVADLVAGLTVGANDYLTKPIAREELLARIRTHLNLSQLREALQIEESKYRSMFENAVEGIFQSSPDGKLLNVNPAYAQLFGYDSPAAMLAEIQEVSGQLYVDPHRRTEFKRLLDEQGEIRDFEVEAYCRDRTQIWVSIWARAVRDSQGTLLHYEGNCVDITQRKQQEASWKRQLEELQIEIDQKQLAQQVAEITSTDYFQQLMAEVEKLRNIDDE